MLAAYCDWGRLCAQTLPQLEGWPPCSIPVLAGPHGTTAPPLPFDLPSFGHLQQPQGCHISGSGMLTVANPNGMGYGMAPQGPVLPDDSFMPGPSDLSGGFGDVSRRPFQPGMKTVARPCWLSVSIYLIKCSV